MSSTLSHSLRALTSLTGAAGIYYMASQRPLRLDSAQNPPGRSLHFPGSMLFSKELTVQRSEQINHDTRRITFSLPGGDKEISGVPAGAAILTQHTPVGRWFPVLRPYTPVSDVEERGVLQLVVKQYPGGTASTHLHSLQPGQTLTVRGPIPGYNWLVPKEARSILLVAGGAGITPIYSLAKGILGNPNDPTRIHLLWGVNGIRDIVLKEELEQLERQHPGRLKVTYCVSGPADAPSFGKGAKYKKGYIDRTVLQEAISQLQPAKWGDEKGTQVFLCGPAAMEAAVGGTTGILAALGVESKKIHHF